VVTVQLPAKKRRGVDFNYTFSTQEWRALKLVNSINLGFKEKERKMGGYLLLLPRYMRAAAIAMTATIANTIMAAKYSIGTPAAGWAAPDGANVA
jgi:hypothetical protein